MRMSIYVVIASVLIAGCSSAGVDGLAGKDQGLAELQVDAAPLVAFDITRVSVAVDGISQDMVLGNSTGTFDGTLILPSGTQSLIASAFSGGTLVGVSNPTPVDIEAGQVTRVMVRILDTSGDAPPLYGPIVDSLSFPTTTQAGASAAFAISVVAPAGDPVTYAWTEDCADGVFSAPAAASTSWSEPATGTCTITVTATSNGIAASESFLIVVFPSGSGSGAATVSGVFVTAPVIQLSLPAVGCFVTAGQNASCPRPIASPATTPYEVSVSDWGLSTPGTVSVSDNCSGQFDPQFEETGAEGGVWLPPVSRSLCIITGSAVNGDGVATTLSVAVLVDDGTPQPPPLIAVQLSNGCSFTSADPVSPADCGTMSPDSVLVLTEQLSGNALSLMFSDDCGGGQVDLGTEPSDTFAWFVAAPRGTTCTVTLQATGFGSSSQAVANYHVQ